MNYNTSLCTLFLLCSFGGLLGNPPDSFSAIYKYVDADGKIQYSNITPPASAKVVDTKKELSDEPEVVEQHLEEKQMETESSFERAKKAQARAKAEAERQRKKADAEKRRLAEEKKELKRKISEEKKYILKKEKSWLSRCDGLDAGFLVVSECRDKVKERTKKDIRALRNGEESYFDSIFSNRRSSENYFESLFRSYEKKGKSSKKDKEYQTK